MNVKKNSYFEMGSGLYKLKYHTLQTNTKENGVLSSFFPYPLRVIHKELALGTQVN